MVISRSRIVPAVFALVQLLALPGCGAVNYLFLEPGEARETQAIDPVDPRDYGDRPEEVTVANKQGNKLVGWLFAREGDRGTVLVAGGNGMGIAHTYTYNRFLLRHGFRVLVFSYQGFDQNEGVADVDSLAGDAEAFYAYVAARFRGEPIGFLGESIGATAGFCAAAEDDFSALALEGLIDPKTVPYTITETWFTPPFSYLLTAMTWPGAIFYTAAIPNDLDAGACSARLRQTDVMFLHQRQDRVSSFATIEHLASLRPSHSSVVELPRPANNSHLSLNHDDDAQRLVIGFLADKFAQRPRNAAGGDTGATHLSASSGGYDQADRVR